MKRWKSYPILEIDNKSSEFPRFLLDLKRPVKKLRFRGKWQSEIFAKSMAVVGSRRCTRYGAEVLDKFIPGLVGTKITIVSGFMYGIDALAHKKTLENNGKTVAVLGGGLNVCSPSENDALYSQILSSGGLVLSEYVDNFLPTLWSFPQRNRIVAGLSSLGVLVVEAGIKSGSLITARLANEMGRDVYAVPGSIFSKTSMGCHELIADLKANLVTSCEDILHLPHQYSEENQLKMFEDLSTDERFIIEILHRETSSIDQIARELKKPSPQIAGLLTVLCMKGVVEEIGGVFRVL